MVYDLSRFARNTGDSLAMLGEIQAKGADFCSINQKIDTATPQGRLMFTMLSVFNTLEREQTAEKVSDNMQRLSKDGLLGRKACYGYRWVKKGAPFEPHPEQQAVIAHVRQMVQNDAKLNVQRIVDFLNGDERARGGAEVGMYYYRTVRQWMVDNDIIPESGKAKKRRGLEQRPSTLPPVPAVPCPTSATTPDSPPTAPATPQQSSVVGQ